MTGKFKVSSGIALVSEQEFENFRVATIERERERCAQVADEKAKEHTGQFGCGSYTRAAVLSVAAAIRALKD